MQDHRKTMMLLLLVIGLIAMLFGCGGDGHQINQNLPTEQSDEYQLPPLPLPNQAIRLSEQIVKQRERSATRSISYNRQAAVDYALNHWNLVRENEDPNKDGYFEPKAYPESLHDTNFRVFKNNCTAFISQCLWAGGVPFYGINLPAKELDYFLAYNWWYDRWEDKRPSIDGVDSRQTHSWVNANTFAWFMFLRIGQAVNSIAKLQPGDVISIDFQGSLIPDVDHSVIVIGNLPNGDVVCAANTESRNDLTMAEIFRKFPDANIWAWHIDSNYIASPESEPPDLIIDHPDDEADESSVPTNSSTTAESSDSSSGSSGPTDTTPPTISWARIDVLGNGRFNLVAELIDNGSGVDKNRFWLQDPAYSWHQIGNWNFDNPSTLLVDLNGQELVGNWKFFVEGFDKSGNHLDRTDTGRAIGCKGKA